MKTVVLIVLMISLTSIVSAKVYRPDDHTQVLIEIEHSVRLQELKVLRQQLKQQANNQALLSNIIAQYIKLGREHADERYFSYAESLLKPYLQQAHLAASIKVQWADILQRQHQFTEAMVILNQVLQSEPSQTQARLMRSVIYQIKGEYKLAMADCKALLGRVDLLLSTTCIAQIDGLQGNLERSIPLLQQTIERYTNNDSETLQWSRTVLAEMFLRAGKISQASDQLDEVLTHANDYYALALKADILLQQARYDEVMALLHHHRKVSKLLLRYVIASNRSGKNQSIDSDTLSAVIERARLFSTGAHKRLLARYDLDVKNNPQLAIITARDNWQRQREPEDALLLVRCLTAANDRTGLQSFRKTFQQQGLRDKRIEAIMAGPGDE